MMELKVVCNCGQKFKFDVEPVNQRMPFAVNCPSCGIDGTPLANDLLMQMAPPVAAPPPIAAPPITRQTAAAPPASRPAMAGAATAPATPKYLQTNKATANNNFAMGIVGAILGGVLGVALMVGFAIFAGFKLPLTGTLIGALIGFGGRLMYRGTSSSLGAVCGGIALLTISTTLFFLFGILGMVTSLISIIIGTAMAFRIASD